MYEFVVKNNMRLTELATNLFCGENARAIDIHITAIYVPQDQTSLPSLPYT